MTILKVSDAQNFAAQAGFSSQVDKTGYSPIATIVAIAMSESNLNTQAFNGNDPNGGSYGILQLNGFWFQHGLTQSCAYDPLCAFQFAYSYVSQHGTNFSDWSTFTSGAYKKNLPVSSLGLPESATGMGSNETIDQVFTNLKLEKWYNEPGGNSFGINNEKGQDYLVSNPGTAVGAILGGQVVNIVNNNNSIGYVVQIMTTDGLHSYQHLQSTTMKLKQNVNIGDVVGLSGGCPPNAYGLNGCAFLDTYSTGPHIEVRWSPSGYVASKGWDGQAWEDPKAHFQSISQQTASALSLSQTATVGSSSSGASSNAVINYIQNNVTLSPNANVAGVLIAIDDWMGLFNPFSVNVKDPGNDISIAGFDTGVLNPLLWLQQVGENFLSILVALIIRVAFLAIAMYMFRAVFFNIVQSDPGTKIAEQIIGSGIGAA